MIGQLFLNRGSWAGERLLSTTWVDQSWAPCPVKHEYGYLWWLNDEQIPWPGAPVAAPEATVDGTCCGWIRPGN